MKLLDKYIIETVKSAEFVYNPKLKHMVSERKTFFDNLAKALSIHFKLKYTGPQASQRWKKLRDNYFLAVRNEKKKKKSTPFVKQVFEECSFLKDYGGMIDNADALSESTSVQDLNEKAPNGDEDGHDSNIDDYDNEQETVNDYEDDEHSSNGLSDQEELSNHASETNMQGDNTPLQNKYKGNTVATNNDKALNSLDQDFQRRRRKANSKETIETNPSLTRSLKELAELVEKNKSADRVKSRSKIICMYLEDLTKPKQPGCLRRVLKIFKKYELK